MQTTFFALIGSSRNAYGGVRWNLDAMVKKSDIIRYANAQLDRRGNSLEEWAGINEFWTDDGDFIGFEREWRDGEELETALKVLNDDGCTYSIWPDDVVDNVRDFLDEAEKIGLGDEAVRLVKKFSPVDEAVFAVA